MASSYTVFSVTHDNDIATCTLNQPEAKNTMGPEFFSELPKVMAELGSDDSVHAIVLAASGDTFSAGLDLKTMGPKLFEGVANSPGLRANYLLKLIHELQDAVSSIEKCPKPVIAAIQGRCLGGGVDLIAACDIRVCANTAIFSIRETPMAIVADLGSLQRLPAIIGWGNAVEMALTGKDITAIEAQVMGLVTHVTEDAKSALATATQIAHSIAANPPLTVQGVKAVLTATRSMSIQQGLDYVATWNSGNLLSEDLAEAFNAFVQKRPPNFKGA